MRHYPLHTQTHSQVSNVIKRAFVQLLKLITLIYKYFQNIGTIFYRTYNLQTYIVSKWKESETVKYSESLII